MLTRRAPKDFPTFHNPRNHRRTADITRQALAPVDINLSAVTIFAPISSHGLWSRFMSHGINAPCCQAVMQQRHEIVREGGELGIGKLIAQAKGKNLLPE